MFRTLLVDDDFLVRSYLKSLTAWTRAGYEVTADVQDAEEALWTLEREDIDVMITDISMPLMDGIELIRQIRCDNNKLYIIVLSCHDDFDYVKEAMRQGADEYVLKNSLNEETLYDILMKTKKHIAFRKEKSTQQKEVDKLLEIRNHALKYHFFNGILSGTLSGSKREEKRLEASILGKFMNSAVITMTAEKWDEVNLDWSLVDSEQYSQTFRLGLAEQMKELLDEDGSSEIIYIGAGVFCCFLDLSSMVRSSVMHQRLTDAASVCFRWCEHQTYVYSISVSNICIGEDGIRQAYQQTREMGKMDFYVKGSILYYDGTNMVSENLSPAAEELIDKIGMIINGRKNKLLEEYWEKILAYTKEMHTDSRVLIHWLKRLDRAAGIERTADFYKTIRDFGQFALIGSNYEEDVFSKKKIEVPEGTSKTVKLAIEFVYHNYKKQIGLQDAAEAAGVNAAYLSFLFKQEMKIGFSNYLQECRIDCARQLLVESNLKIKDVAAESGFNDYHYFSKTFKKLNGCSPAEYRRNGS